MTERRLPFALAKTLQRAGHVNEERYVVRGEDILDWLYGTQGLGLPMYVDDVFAGHEGGLPGLVERVERRWLAHENGVVTWQDALRAELGTEEE